MLFSDNVPLAMEVSLKRLARERGRFLMGPDCGTAIINGVPLGFANAVPRGRIGIAAASGTGLQEVACLIAAGGEGISHAIGVGGRDLSEAVGGLMMESALEALAADARTEVICIVGKPAGARRPGTSGRVGGADGQAVRRPFPRHGRTRGRQRPPVARGRRRPRAAGWHVAATLEDAAQAAIAIARGRTPVAVEFGRPAGEIERARRRRRRPGWGSASASSVACTPGAPWPGKPWPCCRPGWGAWRRPWREVARATAWSTSARTTSPWGDRIPMIDGAVRREWIAREGRDPGTAVLLLDVVLGHGAHRDPAGEVLPALREAREARRGRREDLVVVASVCGTDADPQNRSAQVRALEAGGVIVMPSNAQAARLAALIAARLAARAAP